MPNVLDLKGVGKSYYGTKVLNDINISVSPGEIHALAGENGAGKSTLMNILFGMPVIHETGGFEGEVFVNGEKARINSPKKAMDMGIGMVHQEFMLLPGFTITENIKLNREKTNANIFSKVFGQSLETLDFKKMNEDAKKALGKIGMSIKETTPVSSLPVGYMQFVEIAREIDKKNLKLLVFDEPTAVLTESEADQLLKAMQELAKDGIAILFITHRLDEILEVADNITILRDGQLVETKPKENITVEEIAQKMIGHMLEKSDMIKRSTDYFKDKKEILKLKNLKVDMSGEKVKDISFSVHEGEIFGIGGLAGGGKIGIANGIMGLFPSFGEVFFDGERLPLNNPLGVLKKGLAFVSENRRGAGLLLDHGIDMNIVTTSIQVQNKFLHETNPLLKALRIYHNKEIEKYARKMIEELDIRCRSPKQIVRRLSGGNQQKVCLARAFTLNPKLLFVSEPTRGIDVGAKKLVLDFLVKLNREMGVTIIMTSSELAELRRICDRIAIIAEGELTGILPPEADDVSYGLLMSGSKKEVVSHES